MYSIAQRGKREKIDLSNGENVIVCVHADEDGWASEGLESEGEDERKKKERQNVDRVLRGWEENKGWGRKVMEAGFRIKLFGGLAPL